MVTFLTLVAVAIFDIAMVIPRLTAAVINLHHANPAFHETASRKAGIGKLPLSIEFSGCLGFLGDIEGFRGFGLHPEGDFKRLDTGFELIVSEPLTRMKIIEPVDQVQLLALCLWSEMLVFNVIDDFFGVEFANVTALINPRKKSATPKLWTHNGFSRTKNNEPRQILIFDA